MAGVVRAFECNWRFMRRETSTQDSRECCGLGRIMADRPLGFLQSVLDSLLGKLV